MIRAVLLVVVLALPLAGCYECFVDFRLPSTPSGVVTDFCVSRR